MILVRCDRELLVWKVNLCSGIPTYVVAPDAAEAMLASLHAGIRANAITGIENVRERVSAVALPNNARMEHKS